MADTWEQHFPYVHGTVQEKISHLLLFMGMNYMAVDEPNDETLVKVIQGGDPDGPCEWYKADTLLEALLPCTSTDQMQAVLEGPLALD